MTEENGATGAVDDEATASTAGADDAIATGAVTSAGPEGAVVPPQYGVGPFSVREVALAGVWFVAFVVSFFSRASTTDLRGLVGLGSSVWGSGLDWILTIGVPTVAVGLIVLRRLSPTAIRRVGSLGIDQFASVAFSVSAVVWLATLWNAFAVLALTGVFLAGWVPFVSFLLMLAGVVLTVFAPLLPVVGEDFAHREEQPAHRVARPLRPVSPRPAPVVTAPANGTAVPAGGGAPASGEAHGHGGASAHPDAHATGEQPAYPASVSAETPPDEEAPAAPEPSNKPFWALVPIERDVIDETGAPIFRIGPTAWALVLEDRVDYFVVRHDDGRIGYLMDVAGVTRG